MVSDALPDMMALFKDVREDLLAKMAKKAQRNALLTWRNSGTAPGVAARFTSQGKGFYHFANRRFLYRQKKHDLPDYVATGAFRDALLGRKPRGTRGAPDGIVSTKLSIFGGVMNLLGSKHGGTETVRRIRERIHVPAYTRHRPKVGLHRDHGINTGLVHVRAYEQTQTRRHVDRAISPRSMAEEWAVTDADRAFIQRETDRELHEIFAKTALTKSGGIKRSAREDFREAEEAG